MSGPLPHPSDPEGRFVDLGRGRLWVVDEPPSRGRAESAVGPAVLFFHGIPGSVRDWRYLAPALTARGFRCVRLDLPGFGRSPRETFFALSLPTRAALLPRVADAMGIDQIVVVGHSFGGGPSLLSAALFPLRVAGLVLLNSIGTVRHRGLPPLPGRALRGLSKLMDAPAVGPHLVALMREGYARVGFKGEFTDEDLIFHLQLVSALDFKELRYAAHHVACPTLVVSCEDDPLVEPRIAHTLITDLGGRALRRHVHLATGGHYGQKHHAIRIADEMADLFLR